MQVIREYLDPVALNSWVAQLCERGVLTDDVACNLHYLIEYGDTGRGVPVTVVRPVSSQSVPA